MNPLIVISLIMFAPAILIVLARAKAAYVYLALCVGSVLSMMVGDTALDMVQLFARSYSPTTQSIVQISVLAAPALLTILFLGRTVNGSKWLMNIFPALLVGVLAVFLVVPELPTGTMNAIYTTNIWDKVAQYQALLISVSALLCLGQLWAGGASARAKKRGRHAKT